MRSQFFKLKWMTCCLVVFLFSCAKDKDINDYRTERYQEDLTQLKAVEGTYSGYLVSKANPNINYGALQLTLTATSQTTQNPDNSRASAQPLLVSEVEFQSTTRIVIVGRNSFYDPNTGQFHTEIPIDISTIEGKTNTEVITMTGLIQGGTATGTMQVRGYSSDAGVFTLRSGGPSLGDLAQRKPDVVTDRSPVQKIFFGVGLEPRSKEPTDFTLIAALPPLDQNTELYYLLYPHSERLLQVSFNLREGVQGGTFPKAVWDMKTGILQGRQDIVAPTHTNTISIVCRNFDFNRKDYDFTCTFWSSLNSIPYNFRFFSGARNAPQPPNSKPAPGKAAPKKPAPKKSDPKRTSSKNESPL